MLKSKKHVFWEALVVTIAIFAIGFFLGVASENKKASKLSSFYATSEIDMIDALSTQEILKRVNISCETLKEENIKFADKIYQEAKLLEQYDESEKLTENIKTLHKKYDLLRTLAWINNIKTLEECHNYNLVVYLYNYGSPSAEIKARQFTWSRILTELKQERGSDVLLLPIAADSNLTSLELLKSSFEIKETPAVVINNKEIIYGLESPLEISRLFN